MPRKRKHVTERSSKDLFSYQQAYEEVLSGRSLRKAAEMFNIDHVSLSRYKKKRESAPINVPVDKITMGYNSRKKVFTSAQEMDIVNYAIKSADIYFGLSTRDLRKLAYDLTVLHNLPRPTSWDINEIAGVEWFRNFLDRHPELSVRCAQATSLARATSFNRKNVDEFFDNLSTVLARDNFEAKDIYNVDETGITTVQKPNRIVAKKGSRQVGALTSAERGTLVTITVAANAIGNIIPPMFTFPRVRFQNHFLRNGPVGSVGTANKSGWMQEEDFLVFLKHFQNHTNCSSNHKVLLLLDNHSSHVSIQCIDYCRANGIVMLSYPPHCSHKLQPLDRSVYGPFKKAVNTACDGWMRTNPGRTMTIYDIPGIVTTALPQAMTLTNIQAGFRITGICPYNREIFTDLDFAPSYVTDRPDPNALQSGSNAISSQDETSQPDSNAINPLEISPNLSNPPNATQQNFTAEPDDAIVPSTVTISEIQPDLTRTLTTQIELANGLKVLAASSPRRSAIPQPSTSVVAVSEIQGDLTRPVTPLSIAAASLEPIDPLLNATEKLAHSATPQSSFFVAASSEIQRDHTRPVTHLSIVSASLGPIDPLLNATEKLVYSATPQSSSFVAAASEIQRNHTRPVTPLSIVTASVESIAPSATPQPSSSDVLNLEQRYIEKKYLPFSQNFANISPASSNVASITIQPNFPTKPAISEFLSEHVRPFPKAQPRKTARNTTKRKSTIYTDTPEKENIRLQTEERERKKNANTVKKNLKNIEKKKGKTKTKKKPSQRTPKNVPSSSEDEQTLSFDENDDESVYDVNEDLDQLDSSSCQSDTDDGSSVPQPGDWVVVNIKSMKNLVHRYVGQIKFVTEDGYVVHFAKKVDNHRFKWPIKEDISDIFQYQIVKIIDPPIIHSNGKRVVFEFKKSLRNLKIE